MTRHTIVDEAACLESLTKLVRQALQKPRLSGILLCAPPGAGKTTLSEQVATKSGRPVLRLKHSVLYAASSGDVEAGVESFFARAVAAAPALILIDNIDAIAPVAISGPADLHAIAALDAAFDELALDEQSSAGIVILATAVNVFDIHPTFLRSSRLSVLLHVRPPNWSERRQFLWTALKEAERNLYASSSNRELSKDSITHSDTPGHELDNIASMTPGFLSADLIGLFSSAVHEYSRVESRASDPLCVSRDIVRHMANLVPTICPTLLLTAGAAWHPIPYDPLCVKRLHGLKKQTDLLSNCVRYAFPPPSTQRNGNCAAIEELHALGTIAGVVLSGPAGSGKTTLARAATAFLPQGFVNAFHLDSSEIVGSVVGSTEQKLRTLFAIARSTAPTILVIENIDVLAQRREGGAERHTSSSVAAFQRILSTLLVELDGIVHHNNRWADSGKDFSSRSNLLIIATTSCISRVDPAILRPGRLEVHIDLCLPDENARLNIICDFLHRAAPHLLPKIPENLPRCDSWLHAIAKKTAGWSGAEMHGLCNEAGLAALRQLQTSSTPVDILRTRVILSRDHFVQAMSSLKI